VLKIIEKLPPKPEQIGPRGGLRYPFRPTFRVECTECEVVYLTTVSYAQILRSPRCGSCAQRLRFAR
jgi:hypothetical protein